MTASPTISRSQLIMGICLPLALLLGYVLAEPMDLSGMGLVVMVVAVICSPLLIWWYHPLLIASWNAVLWAGLIPGTPMIWMLMAFGGFFLAIINRAVNPGRKFLVVPVLNWVFLALFLVVFGTAWVTGGLGLSVLGSQQYGGRNYITIALALMGYYALTSRAIPLPQANTFTGVYFLSGLTALCSNLVYLGGQSLWFLFLIFPAAGAYYQYSADLSVGPAVSRVAGLDAASQAVWAFLLCRYGVAGVFNLRHLWRAVLLLVSLVAGLYAGFRSGLCYFALAFVILFHLERLWRTRLLALFLVLALVAGAGVAVFSRQLPLSVQRSLSIFPVDVDPVASMDAASSTEWRLEMWRRVLPDVPQYLFKGKGYTLNPHDLALVEDAVRLHRLSSYEMALFAGDYHNGPLSVLLPFGIYGAVVFLALFIAGGWVLWRNSRYGREELRTINRFLFALFLTKVVFFMVVFGSAFSDLFVFTGLLGLGVSLNGGVAQKGGNR